MGAGASRSGKRAAGNGKKSKAALRVKVTAVTQDAPKVSRRSSIDSDVRVLKNMLSNDSAISSSKKAVKRSVKKASKKSPAESIEGFESRGVSAAFLRQFQAMIVERYDELCEKVQEDGYDTVATASVCAHIVVPETKADLCAYIDLVADQRDETGVPFVGQATVFCSHAWKYDAVDVIDCILEFDDERDDSETTEYYWFDTLVVCQHEKPDAVKRDQRWWAETFKAAIGQIGTTLLILMPWEHPIPITRAWCLWEILSTLLEKSRLEIRMPLSEMGRFCEGLLQPDSVQVSNAMRCLEGMDVRNAQAWIEDDRKMILNAVEASKSVHLEGNSMYSGFHGTNMAIKAQVRAWFIGVSEQCELEYFDQLEMPETEREEKHVYLMFNMGLLLKTLGKAEMAEVKWMEALALAEEYGIAGLEDIVGVIHTNLGNFYKAKLQRDDARDHYSAAIKHFKTRIQNGVTTAFVRTTLAKSYVNLGLLAYEYDEAEEADFRDAIEHYNRAMSIFNEVHGTSRNPDTLNALNSIGAAQLKLDDFDGAYKSFSEAKNCISSGTIDAQANALALAKVDLNLGVVERRRKNWSQAQKHYQEALIVYEQILGSHHQDVAGAMNNLASVYEAQACEEVIASTKMRFFRKSEKYYAQAYAVLKACGLQKSHPSVRLIERNIQRSKKSIRSAQSGT